MKKIAVLGPSGTFSETAYYKLCGQNESEIVFEPTIASVFERLKETDGAVVPIENTLDGFVSQTIDELIERNLHLVRECSLDVQYAFLLNGTSPSECRRLFVQFAAMGQCQRFLATLPHDVAKVMTSSNMESHRLLLAKVPGDGAIVPIDQANGFEGFVQSGVADSILNATRFVLVQKAPCSMAGGTIRVAVAVTPREDRPGLLYDLLGIFKKYGVNLSAILSRPAKSAMGVYRFYLEMIGKEADEASIRQAVQTAQNAFDIRILGIIPAVLHSQD